ncbi:hypothetical protein J4475_01990 [Candidatus Woesearchaeota archaeon]|nr:hypothetical protein [Candidatus Woesearchaeota archaeon]
MSNVSLKQIAWWKLGFGAVFALLVVSLLVYAKPLLFIASLILIGAFSMIHRRYAENLPIGGELVVFGTVLSGLAYGLAAALATGLAGMALGKIMNSRLDQKLFIPLIGIILVASSTLFLKGSPVFFAGIVATLLYNAVIYPLFVLTGSHPATSAIRSVTDIIINIIAFRLLGELIFALMV